MTHRSFTTLKFMKTKVGWINDCAVLSDFSLCVCAEIATKPVSNVSISNQRCEIHTAKMSHVVFRFPKHYRQSQTVVIFFACYMSHFSQRHSKERNPKTLQVLEIRQKVPAAVAFGRRWRNGLEAVSEGFEVDGQLDVGHWGKYCGKIVGWNASFYWSLGDAIVIYFDCGVLLCITCSIVSLYQTFPWGMVAWASRTVVSMSVDPWENHSSWILHCKQFAGTYYDGLEILPSRQA